MASNHHAQRAWTEFRVVAAWFCQLSTARPWPMRIVLYKCNQSAEGYSSGVHDKGLSGAQGHSAAKVPGSSLSPTLPVRLKTETADFYRGESGGESVISEPIGEA